MANGRFHTLEDAAHRFQSRSGVLALLLLLTAAGCGGRATLADDLGPVEDDAGTVGERGYNPTDEEVLEKDLSESERRALREIREFQGGPQGDYRINTSDRLSIVFYGDPSIDRQVMVRPDGKISFPRIGDIPAAGLTPVELSGAISELYAEYLKNPEATVIVEEPGDQVVYVLGEVRDPGIKAIRGNMTLAQAIANASGWTQTGNLSSVMVMRRGGWERPRAIRIDAKKIFSGERLEYDIPLRPFDIVYVPQSFIGDVGDFADNFFNRVIGPPMTSIIRGYDAFNLNRAVILSQ